MKKIISFGIDAQERLKNGIDTVANAVKQTIGPAGRNVIIGRPYQTPLITNDGYTVAKEIILDDEIEELGAGMVKEVSKLTNDKSGDGTSTTTVLLQSIVNTIHNKTSKKTLLDTSTNVMDIKREIEESCNLVISEIDKVKNTIKTKEELVKIATISVEDATLGERIADMVWELGKDALVNVELSHARDIDFLITGGAEIKSGWVSEYLCTDGKEAIYEKPNILITNHKIESSGQLHGVIKTLVANNKKSLVIICDSFDKSTITPIVTTHMTTEFKILLIKIPQMNQPEYLSDIQAIVGGEFIDYNKGMKIKDVTRESFGTCGKLVTSKDNTILTGVKKPDSKILKDIKNDIETADSLFDKEKLQKRLAFLTSSVGLIKVGAESETEKEYIKLKIDDAVYATKSALEDGYVKGGGLCLKEIAESKETILSEALVAPYNQIQENAGGKLEISKDVIDPAKVVKNAVINACSVAKIFLTTSVAIADKNEKKKDQSFDE